MRQTLISYGRYTLWWGGLALCVAFTSCALWLFGHSCPLRAARYYQNLCHRIAWWTRKCLNVSSQPLNISRDSHFIITANHQSFCDTPLVITFLADYGIYPKFLLKRSLERIPGFKSYARCLGFIWVDREHPRRTARSIQEAARNPGVCHDWFLFPEGTRAPLGSLAPPKAAGMFWLCAHFPDHQWFDISLIYHGANISLIPTSVTRPSTADALSQTLQSLWHHKASLGLTAPSS